MIHILYTLQMFQPSKMLIKLIEVCLIGSDLAHDLAYKIFILECFKLPIFLNKIYYIDGAVKREVHHLLHSVFCAPRIMENNTKISNLMK